MNGRAERREDVMRGTITAREVIRYAPTIIRCFGPGCYLACLRAALSRQRSTFLEVLCRCGAVRPSGRAA
jgi:hypothetical protein